MSKQEILLFSGGLDSLIAWYYLGKPPCLYLDLGHKYAAAEKTAVQKIAAATEMEIIYDNRLYLGDMEHADALLPMRNSFLVHTAAFYGSHIWLIVQKGELHLPDRSPHFLEVSSNLLSELNERQVTVASPFLTMTKTQMVGWYVAQGLPQEVLLMSSSCYLGNNCGTCAACFRRWVSLEIHDIAEPFVIAPWRTPTALGYAARAWRGEYETERTKEILAALAKRGVV